jgi:hypothetical protein
MSQSIHDEEAKDGMGYPSGVSAVSPQDRRTDPGRICTRTLLRAPVFRCSPSDIRGTARQGIAPRPPDSSKAPLGKELTACRGVAPRPLGSEPSVLLLDEQALFADVPASERRCLTVAVRTE